MGKELFSFSGMQVSSGRELWLPYFCKGYLSPLQKKAVKSYINLWKHCNIIIYCYQQLDLIFNSQFSSVQLLAFSFSNMQTWFSYLGNSSDFKSSYSEDLRGRKLLECHSHIQKPYAAALTGINSFVFRYNIAVWFWYWIHKPPPPPKDSFYNPVPQLYPKCYSLLLGIKISKEVRNHPRFLFIRLLVSL